MTDRSIAGRRRGRPGRPTPSFTTVRAVASRAETATGEPDGPAWQELVAVGAVAGDLTLDGIVRFAAVDHAVAAAALDEIGIDTAGEFPKTIDPALLARVDRVVILGSDAQVTPVDGMAGSIERWVIAAESATGLDSAARARRVRDEIRVRVEALAAELLTTH